MGSVTSPPSNERQLAAILFTDVVSFSARMAKDEMRTLQLVQRDLGWMGQICEANRGQVLKNTGDGLLLYFTSVHDAFNSAVTMQDGLDQMTETYPPDQVLQHRMGLHLGDVFFSGNDVMGDGVNISARVMAQSEPNGITMTSTVYDLVQSVCERKPDYMGTPKLKNIERPIQTFQLRCRLAAVDPTKEQDAPTKRGSVTQKLQRMRQGSAMAKFQPKPREGLKPVEGVQVQAREHVNFSRLEGRRLAVSGVYVAVFSKFKELLAAQGFTLKAENLEQGTVEATFRVGMQLFASGVKFRFSQTGATILLDIEAKEDLAKKVDEFISFICESSYDVTEVVKGLSSAAKEMHPPNYGPAS